MAFGKHKGLIGLVHLHVDDMLIAGDSQHEFDAFKKKLQKVFKFGKWISDPIMYCGGKINQNKSQVELSFSEYVQKIKPIPVEYGHRPTSSYEVRLLLSLIHI